MAFVHKEPNKCEQCHTEAIRIDLILEATTWAAPTLKLEAAHE